MGNNMTPFVHTHILPAALSLLPERMDSPEARVLLLAIGLQESRFKNRTQGGGPARGLWQFEANGGVRGVLEHHASAAHAITVCERLLYPPSVAVVYNAIAHNDVLAACFARLLLWTAPAPLPALGDAGGAWRYYLAQWRPGKPYPGSWESLYRQAWEHIQ